MTRIKKIEASAIYYALFLSVIFGLMLGGFLLFSGFNQNFSLQMDIEELLIDNAKSGIAYGQANFTELKPNEPINLRLFNNGVDSVQIEKKIWGAFTIIRSTAVHRNKEVTKIALLGGENSKTRPNFYLVDNGRPLSLCGTARIEGNCRLPKAGVKRAFIGGKNYQGTSMIYGKSEDSERTLPAIRTSFLQDMEASSGQILAWENVDSIETSFAQEGAHYIIDDYINLDGIFIKGQVIIEAKDSIFVGRNAQIENIILKSDVVYIESGFTGTLQIIASKKIVLEKGVILKYPSVIGVLEDVYPEESAAEIKLAELSQIIGSVFLISKTPNFRKQPLLSIATTAEIDGLVYCAGKTELKGTIKGSLFANKLFLKTASSSYENHLMDGQILADLPKEFIAANLLDETSLLKRISWLQ